MLNFKGMFPQLTHFDKMMPKQWKIKLIDNKLVFLTQLSITPNLLKMSITVKVSKSTLGTASSIPENYDILCMEKFIALTN